jgi:hypothetical protein
LQGSGHAFILRRFDTGAISLTTMFRAAFPEASEAEERRETAWVKENFDVAKNNGSSKDQSIVRLAGVWVSPEDALGLADSYSLGGIIKAMAAASPDPSANYRRSAKTVDKNAHPSPPVSKKLPSPPMTDSPNPAKRRKEASPPSSKTQSQLLAVPRRSARTKSSSPAPPNPTPASPPRRPGSPFAWNYRG